MKPRALIIFILVLSGCIHAQEWRHRWQVSGQPHLKISTEGMDVSLESGPANTVEAVLDSEGWSMGKPAADVQEHQSGDNIDLQAHARSFVGYRVLHLRVRVPQSVAVEVRSGSGSIALHGLHGSLHLETTVGGIQADGLDGSVEAGSSSGSLHLQGRFDAMDLRSTSGSIDAAALPGSKLSSQWQVQSEKGSVLLKVPPSLAAEVEARTSTGEIKSELPLALTGFQGKDQLQGRLNGGGSLLLVSTRSGSIHLSN